jgi:hypothetical protein
VRRRPREVLRKHYLEVNLKTTSLLRPGSYYGAPASCNLSGRRRRSMTEQELVEILRYEQVTHKLEHLIRGVLSYSGA